MQFYSCSVFHLNGFLPPVIITFIFIISHHKLSLSGVIDHTCDSLDYTSAFLFPSVFFIIIIIIIIIFIFVHSRITLRSWDLHQERTLLLSSFISRYCNNDVHVQKSHTSGLLWSACVFMCLIHSSVGH